MKNRAKAILLAWALLSLAASGRAQVSAPMQAGPSGGGGSTAAAGTSGNIQYNNGGVFGGISDTAVNASSVTFNGVQYHLQVSTIAIIGQDTGNCNALLSIGTTGTRCAGSGNNFTDHSLLVHNNGGACVTVADQSDANENDLCTDSTGARTGPNVANTTHSLLYSTNNPAIRIGGATGVVTVGRIASQDAGTTAALYINFPSTAAVGGTMYSSMASTSTIANTNLIGLYQFAVPANTLKNSGDCLILTCGAAGAATATTKRIVILFNNTTLSAVNGTAIADTGAVTANNADLDATARICKNGSNTQVVIYSEAQAVGTFAALPAPPAPAATDTGIINVSCGGQNGTANSGDVVGKGFTVDFKPAP